MDQAQQSQPENSGADQNEDKIHEVKAPFPLPSSSSSSSLGSRQVHAIAHEDVLLPPDPPQPPDDLTEIQPTEIQSTRQIQINCGGGERQSADVPSSSFQEKVNADMSCVSQSEVPTLSPVPFIGIQGKNDVIHYESSHSSLPPRPFDTSRGVVEFPSEQNLLGPTLFDRRLGGNEDTDSPKVFLETSPNPMDSGFKIEEMGSEDDPCFPAPQLLLATSTAPPSLSSLNSVPLSPPPISPPLLLLLSLPPPTSPPSPPSPPPPSPYLRQIVPPRPPPSPHVD
mmetsp:Transcript_3201/g.5278  ORF Transcript_3201/g.5278 Transcript_3201/m.5278 type:complete len:282 (+) Transcript_3201:92-937(+)